MVYCRKGRIRGAQHDGIRTGEHMRVITIVASLALASPAAAAEQRAGVQEVSFKASDCWRMSAQGASESTGLYTASCQYDRAGKAWCEVTDDKGVATKFVGRNKPSGRNRVSIRASAEKDRFELDCEPKALLVDEVQRRISGDLGCFLTVEVAALVVTCGP